MSWLIIDRGRELFWKKNNYGYTMDVKEARLFSDEEASEKVEGDNSLFPVDFNNDKYKGDMLAVIKKPNIDGYATMINNTLEDLQDIVKGYIEVVRLTDDLVLVINEEGKIFGHEYNFSIPCYSKHIEDICGTVAILRVDGEDFTGLLPEDLLFLEMLELI